MHYPVPRDLKKSTHTTKVHMPRVKVTSTRKAKYTCNFKQYYRSVKEKKNKQTKNTLKNKKIVRLYLVVCWIRIAEMKLCENIPDLSSASDCYISFNHNNFIKIVEPEKMMVNFWIYLLTTLSVTILTHISFVQCHDFVRLRSNHETENPCASCKAEKYIGEKLFKFLAECVWSL